ncbi:MAG: hypothetical protein ACRCZI_07350 [Cetobacterium sp.]
MVIVKNIQESELDLRKELKNLNNASMQKILKYASKDKLETFLPIKSKKTVSFELHESNTDLANSIRVCLEDEIETFSFDFDEYHDLDTDDLYILCDFIKKQIDLLPINQQLDYNSKFELYKKNDSDEIIDVLTDDIYISGNSNKYKISDVVNNDIPICKLRPNKYIKISNIVISKGNAITDAGKYKLLSNVSYKIIDADLLNATPLKTTGTSSLMTNPKKFVISYSTHRNIDKPKEVMEMCCDTLINRLKRISDEMKNIKNSDDIYSSDVITLKTTKNTKEILISNEYLSIVSLITRYAFILTNNEIEFITPAILHPEKEIGVIKLVHPEFSSLIQNSCKKIISDLEVVKKAF